MGLSFEACKKIVDLTPYPRPERLAEEEKEEVCSHLLKFLLKERGMIAAFSASYEKKRHLVRCYMNERPALPIPREILGVQDRLFWTETCEKGLVEAETLAAGKYGICLTRGDITAMRADAVVTAANKSLLGCFLPAHQCVDNAVHSAAGMQLRDDCAKLMAAQGTEEECGEAKLTRAYNLPATYVLHTVGPMVGREVSEEERAQLRSCYVSCLNLAAEAGLKSVAFTCISTGVFNFPRDEAAEIAVGAVVNWKLRTGADLRVVFNTYLPEDEAVYSNILRYI